MAGGISPVLSESFEDVLNAVQETARGRWFLEEYTKRKKTEDTAAILAAILKLENAMARTPDTGDAQQHAVLERARQAIANARSQIKSLSSAAIPLSEEAQVFSKLAELSRQAFNTETEAPLRDTIGKGVEVALRLVSELDTSFGGSEAASGQQTEPARSQKYFQQDVEIFEAKSKNPPAMEIAQNTAEASPAIEAAVVAEAPIVKEPPIINTSAPASARPADIDPPQKGARLTIHRPSLRSENAPDATASNATNATASPDDVPALKSGESGEKRNVPEAPPAAAKAVEQRIVIIRRKPGEQIEVPLVDVPAKSTAA